MEAEQFPYCKSWKRKYNGFIQSANAKKLQRIRFRKTVTPLNNIVLLKKVRITICIIVTMVHREKLLLW